MAGLNDAERQVLALLAQGHTAKSIANLTGSSVGAVNERLRAARRKTGATSSRELARLLAQENGDELIGLASPPSAIPASPRAARPPARWRLIVMLGSLTLLAALAVALLPSGAPPAPLPPDPLTASFTAGPQPPNFSRLRRQLLGETRDPAWAVAAEQALAARYRALLAPDSDVRVRCARTLCEVAGSLPGKNVARANRDMQAMQDSGWRSAFLPVGLDDVQSVFGGAVSGRPDQMLFLQYWRRAGAAWPADAAS